MLMLHHPCSSTPVWWAYQQCINLHLGSGIDHAWLLGVVLQVVINCGALQCLLSLLTANHKKSIKKEACWTISNITAGTKEQIQSVIDNQLIPPLVHLLGVSSRDQQHYTAWVGVQP
jgi:hypothetical protein